MGEGRAEEVGRAVGPLETTDVGDGTRAALGVATPTGPPAPGSMVLKLHGTPALVNVLSPHLI